MDICEVSTIFEYLETVTTLTKGGTKLWYRGGATKDYNLVPGLIWREETHLENDYVHDFLVGYQAYSEKSSHKNPWELFTLMQHHGLPTRLLDWSKSPLNALYFALTQEAEKNTNRIVWILHPQLFNKVTLGQRVVYCPGELASRNIVIDNDRNLDLDSYLPSALDPSDNYNLPVKPIAIESPLCNSRIKGQMGCFTVHGTAQEGIAHYLQSQKNLDHEAPFTAGILLKTKDNKKSFLEPLLSWGITEEHIYQDLDSLVARIIRERNKD